MRQCYVKLVISYLWKFCIWYTVFNGHPSSTLLPVAWRIKLTIRELWYWKSFMVWTQSNFTGSSFFFSPFSNIGFCCARFLRRALWFCLCSWPLFMSAVLLTLSIGQNAVGPSRPQLFIQGPSNLYYYLNTPSLLYSARDKSIFGYVLEGK